jgi:hypothetical protein
MEIVAELGRFNQDAAQTMGAIVVVFGLVAYWIVKG